MSNKVYNRAELRELELQHAKSFNLSVKNIKTFSGHDGMVGVNADIYHNNKKFATFYDDAWGGEPKVDPFGKTEQSFHANRIILRDLEEKAKNLPKVEYKFKDIDNTYTNTFWLHTLVDTLINAELERKELARDAKKGIVYVDPKDNETYIWQWGNNLAKFLKMYPTSALNTVQEAYNKLKKEGCIVKNTELLAEYGVKL